MNWQPIDVQPFDPSNHHSATLERRRRLFGRPTCVTLPERLTASSQSFDGVQQDAHVKAWEKFHRSMPIGRYSQHVFKRCAELGANYADVIGPTRHLDLIPVRHRIMWELRNRFDPAPSFSEIGAIFRRDHTSIIYAVQKWDGKTKRRK